MTFNSLVCDLRGAKRFVFVTGAGMSKESGIPTFRGKDGYWRRYDPIKLATIGAFYENPKLVWEWYEDRRRNILAAKPNAGHEAIAALEKHRRVVVLTQNIDNLHQRAESSRVLELHGSIVRVRCTRCSFVDNAVSEFAQLPPSCACGQILRPDVVWFGESLPQNVWEEAAAEAECCDVMVVAGTSLTVSPANTLPLRAKRYGACLIEINPEATPLSSVMELSMREAVSSALPRLVERVLA